MAKNYRVNDNAKYNPNIRELQNRDPINAEEIINPMIQQMIDNTHAVKKRVDDLEGGVSAAKNAETAEKLKTPVKINGVGFDGSKDITVIAAANGGNSDTTDKLKTARKISLSGGATGTATAFDGTKDIAIPVTGLNMGHANAGTLAVARGGTGQTSVQALRNSMGLGNTTGALPVANGGTGNTTGNAPTATKLQNARTINGVAFDGSKNITIPDVTVFNSSRSFAAGPGNTVPNDCNFVLGNTNFLDTNVKQMIVLGGWHTIKDGSSFRGSIVTGEGNKLIGTYNFFSLCGGLYNEMNSPYTLVWGIRNKVSNGYNSHRSSLIVGVDNEVTIKPVNAWGSYCLGDNNKLKEGVNHFAFGTHLIVNEHQTVIGRYNKETEGWYKTDGSVFVIGKGANDNQRSNAFRVSNSGDVYSNGAYNTTGADYAEYFEWKDGNPDGEDRRGLFVTLDGENITLADEKTVDILGVASSDPALIGDSHDDEWQGKYNRDIFGKVILEPYTIKHYVDENKTEYKEETILTESINPKYRSTEEYIPRSERPEWSAVGLLGKLVLIDDGTCEVNGYCKPKAGGIATKSEEKTNYRVMSRLDDTHIRVFVK